MWGADQGQQVGGSSRRLPGRSGTAAACLSEKLKKERWVGGQSPPTSKSFLGGAAAPEKETSKVVMWGREEG